VSEIVALFKVGHRTYYMLNHLNTQKTWIKHLFLPMKPFIFI